MKWSFGRAFVAFTLMASFGLSHPVEAAAIDDIRLEVSAERCEGFDPGDKSFVVYATNASPSQSIDARFKYDSVPAQQRFILFDANLKPITDRFPKYHARRLAPREAVPIGCTSTYRASLDRPGALTVPVLIAIQSAKYADPGDPEAAGADAGSFAAFTLQGGINECGPGARPAGLLYVVNLHPFARLSASIALADERGNRVGAVAVDLAPLSARKVGCSNGSSRPGSVTNAALELRGAAVAAIPTPATALNREVKPQEAKPVEIKPADAEPQEAGTPLTLGALLQTQYVCAGSLPPGWIKINDAWNSTVCGNPTGVAFNVWTLQRLSDQAPGNIIQACRAAVPPGWVLVGTTWNPTVCGHPASRESNVMAIKRLSH